MRFLGLIVRIVLILFIIRMIVMFFARSRRRAAPRAGAAGPHARNASAATLVRDPQCGTYVAADQRALAP